MNLLQLQVKNLQEIMKKPHLSILPWSTSLYHMELRNLLALILLLQHEFFNPALIKLLAFLLNMLALAKDLPTTLQAKWKCSRHKVWQPHMFDHPRAFETCLGYHFSTFWSARIPHQLCPQPLNLVDTGALLIHIYILPWLKAISST